MVSFPDSEAGNETDYTIIGNKNQHTLILTEVLTPNGTHVYTHSIPAALGF